MTAKAKVKAVLKNLKEIQEALPIGGIEQLAEEIQTEILDPLGEKLDALAEKDELTEKQEERQAALEDEKSEWEDIRDELETYLESLNEIENLIERVDSLGVADRRNK